MFNGPIFIVGLPRSGTKLLREILNQHSKISLTAFETEFFPYLVRNWKKFGDLSKFENFEKFYKKIIKFPYFYYCSNAGKLISCDTWFNLCKNFTPADIFEALIRHDVDAIYEDKIWGDKSPSYVNYLKLLKENFPSAKFIHIIRDVRDYCISINKAWGKNMYRAAQRWVDSIISARNQAEFMQEDYFEIKYEDLITNPKESITKICNFLEISFEEKMLELSKPVENIGDAKGKREILKTNYKKYEHQLNPYIKNKIELIAGPLLQELKYPISSHKEYKRLSKIEMAIYKMFDGFNLLKTDLVRMGFLKTLKFWYGLLLQKLNL